MRVVLLCVFAAMLFSIGNAATALTTCGTGLVNFTATTTFNALHAAQPHLIDDLTATGLTLKMGAVTIDTAGYVYVSGALVITGASNPFVIFVSRHRATNGEMSWIRGVRFDDSVAFSPNTFAAHADRDNNIIIAAQARGNGTMDRTGAALITADAFPFSGTPCRVAIFKFVGSTGNLVWGSFVPRSEASDGTTAQTIALATDPTSAARDILLGAAVSVTADGVPLDPSTHKYDNGLFRINGATGAVKFSTNWGDVGQNRVHGVGFDSKGQCIVAGTTNGFTSNARGYVFFMGCQTSFSFVLNTTYGVTAGKAARMSGVGVDACDNVYISGQMGDPIGDQTPSGTFSNAVVFMLNSTSGAVEWAKMYGGTGGNANSPALAVTSFGNAIAIANGDTLYFGKTTASASVPIVSTFDHAGNLLGQLANDTTGAIGASNHHTIAVNSQYAAIVATPSASPANSEFVLSVFPLCRTADSTTADGILVFRDLPLCTDACTDTQLSLATNHTATCDAVIYHPKTSDAGLNVILSSSLLFIVTLFAMVASFVYVH